MSVWALDVCVVPSTAEATLRVHAIGETSQLPILATVIPEIRHRPMSQNAPADIHSLHWMWAKHLVKGRFAAEPALVVYAVSFAAEHPRVAVRLVIIWHCGNIFEGAHLRARAMDMRELALAAVPALHVLAVGVAAMHPQDTPRLPISWDKWL